MAMKLRIEDDSFYGGASKCHNSFLYITRNIVFYYYLFDCRYSIFTRYAVEIVKISL